MTDQDNRPPEEIVAEANELEKMIVDHVASGPYHGRDARLVATALLAGAARVALAFRLPPEVFFALVGGMHTAYVNGLVQDDRTPAND
jgi:hypothetical protein